MVDLCVEFLYLWVSMGRGAEGVSINNESFGVFSVVRYFVRDVLLCGALKDLPEQELTRAAGGR